MQLRKITPEQSDKECYTSHDGLTLLGQAIRLAGLRNLGTQHRLVLYRCHGEAGKSARARNSPSHHAELMRVDDRKEFITADTGGDDEL
jgi:hypothetical protein